MQGRKISRRRDAEKAYKRKRIPEKHLFLLHWLHSNWKTVKEMGIPDHLTCLLRNLYAGHEATVRTGRGQVTNWERITSRLYIVTLHI